MLNASLIVYRSVMSPIICFCRKGGLFCLGLLLDWCFDIQHHLGGFTGICSIYIEQRKQMRTYG